MALNTSFSSLSTDLSADCFVETASRADLVEGVAAVALSPLGLLFEWAWSKSSSISSLARVSRFRFFFGRCSLSRIDVPAPIPLLLEAEPVELAMAFFLLD
jgi:hypothetical protein